MGKKFIFSKDHHSKNYNEISFEELQKFFGLCLLRAKLGTPVLRNCFGTNPLNYYPIFNYTMSGIRLESILSCLNCSESIISPEDTDRLRKMSTLFKLIIYKFQNSYIPLQYLSLDESMLLWQGRLIFRQYIKNKRNKFSIKFYELCTWIYVTSRNV